MFVYNVWNQSVTSKGSMYRKYDLMKTSFQYVILEEVILQFRRSAWVCFYFILSGLLKVDFPITSGKNRNLEHIFPFYLLTQLSFCLLKVCFGVCLSYPLPTQDPTTQDKWQNRNLEHIFPLYLFTYLFYLLKVCFGFCLSNPVPTQTQDQARYVSICVNINMTVLSGLINTTKQNYVSFRSCYCAVVGFVVCS